MPQRTCSCRAIVRLLLDRVQFILIVALFSRLNFAGVHGRELGNARASQVRPVGVAALVSLLRCEGD